MEIPKACYFPAGSRLSHGEYEDSEHRNARLVGAPVAVDVDGDGSREMASFFNCNQGGTGWPDQLVVVGRGGHLIGENDFGPILEKAPGAHGVKGKSLGVAGNKIRFSLNVAGAYTSDSDMFKSHVSMGTARMRGGKLVVKMDPGPWKNASFAMQGYGPVKVGSRVKNMPGVQYNSCGIVRVSGKPRNLDIVPDDSGTVIKHVGTRDPRFHTRSGAHVGMSEKQLRKICGSALKPVTGGAQSPEDGLAMSSGGHSMAFWLDYEDRHVTTIYVSDGPAGPVSFCDIGYEEDES
ncbi:MAG: hypothetical protein R5N60_07875 [Cutibacterium granulosum]|nr:hypothetical protein [Cutibacterium granulosum]